MSEQQGTGFYRFTIGDFKIATLSDGFMFVENPKVLLAGDVADAEYESLVTSKFLSPATSYTHFNSLFVDTGKNKILIDTGCGPYAGPTGGQLPINLRNLGISPEEIDTVFLSHGHMDHLGGNVGPDGAQLFPNARYVIGQKEWEFWNQDIVTIGQSYPDQGKQFLIKIAKEQLQGVKDRVELVQSGQEVVPGITAEEAYGHSGGMLAANIASGAESLLSVSDAFTHFAISVEHPEWQIGADNDRAKAVQTRLRLLDRVSAEKSLMFAPHFPFPGIGHIAKYGRSNRWEPAVWTW
jgi:glyoxylase-like metal-dependent hydrolase (beta-lactamase superfamily II)